MSFLRNVWKLVVSRRAVAKTAKPDSDRKSRATAELLADDPFFKLPDDSDWNACIGKQGNELNYLDGYIEAAIEAVNTVIEKKMYEKRDTIVLPVLYNARHAVELLLKFTVDRLVAVGAIPHGLPRNHDIHAYWTLLDKTNVGDEKLRECIRALAPFVESLSRIDEDGQELRYHLNRDQGKSLSTYTLANLEVIRESLGKLFKIVTEMTYRTVDFVDERAVGAFTSRVSRRDLMEIANMMPPLSPWKEAIFNERKAAVKVRFGLSNRQFAKALKIIKGNREMKALLGAESPLLYLTDEDVVWVIDQWTRAHPPRDKLALDYFDPTRLDAMKEHLRIENEVVDVVTSHLTDDGIAELQTLYYLGRDGWATERYQEEVNKAKRAHAIEKDQRRQISHLMEKTNFLMCVRKGLFRLGRLTLFKKLPASSGQQVSQSGVGG